MEKRIWEVADSVQLQTMPLSAISRWHYSLVYWLP
jgi:hypothetical protein